MRIGIIGCGYWGPNLIRNFNALDDVHVTAAGDIRRERLEFISKQYPAIRVFTTEPNEILHSPAIDAVVIATPVSTHFCSEWRRYLTASTSL